MILTDMLAFRNVENRTVTTMILVMMTVTREETLSQAKR